MKTLVVGAAMIDMLMKIEALPKSGEDVLCSESGIVIGGRLCLQRGKYPAESGERRRPVRPRGKGPLRRYDPFGAGAVRL